MKKIIIDLILLLIVFSNLYSQGIPYGQEFLINTYTTNFQFFPSIASLSDGGFVVCWESYEQDGSGVGIYGQIFDSYCNQRGNEFQMNTYVNELQEWPYIAGLTNGGFIACWQSWEQDGSGYGIFGQVFYASGAKRGTEFKINKYVENFQFNPSVTGLKSGRFVVCWESHGQDGSGAGIYGQIFEASGAKKGNEFRVNTQIEGDQRNPSITGLKDGGFVVFWEGHQQYGSGYGIGGQIFDTSGNKKGNEFHVSSSGGSEDYPSVAALINGGFVVCWESQRQGDSWSDIYGQVFEFNGTKTGNEFLINTYTEDYQAYPSVAGLSDGRFVVCWADFRRGIFCQIFDINCAKIGYEFQANTFPSQYGAQGDPSVAALIDGRFVICWESDKQDGGAYGIIGKYFLNEPIIHYLKEFSLIAPANDQTIDVIHPTFQWRQPSNFRECYPWELTFDLYIDTDSNFPHPQIIKNIEDTTYTIDFLAAGKTYFWKALAKNLAGDSLWSTQQDWGFFIKPGATLVEKSDKEMPVNFELFQNYPNPFNSSTEIKYCLLNEKASYKVQVKIYDVLGRLVKVVVDQEQSAGTYSVHWDGTDLRGDRVSSGMYFYSLEAGDLKSFRKMLVLQ